LLPALHAHLPCTTLLNSEECALSEKKKKKKWQHVLLICATVQTFKEAAVSSVLEFTVIRLG